MNIDAFMFVVCTFVAIAVAFISLHCCPAVQGQAEVNRFTNVFYASDTTPIDKEAII